MRARIVALTWLAGRVARAARARGATELGALDDPREELLVLQTLVGALPIERERLDGYLEKALREGKVNTNWLAPNEEHERARAGVGLARRRAARSATRSSTRCARSGAGSRSRSCC